MFPTLAQLNLIIENEEKTIQFLKDNHVFYEINHCEHCGSSLSLYGKNYRCNKHGCRKWKSILQHSFFAKSRLKCNDILFIGYLWLSGCNRAVMTKMTSHSSTTITEFINYYRQLISISLNDEDQIIGGPGIIVEIDESKFGKRKYNRGHKVEGVWVLGGVERTSERKIFVKVINNRSEKTLLDVISRHVLPGSIIYTDLWKGYYNLKKKMPVRHMTVNHSLNFVDPNTHVHTNTIEGTWNGIKLGVPPRNRSKDSMEGHLLEFIWKRKHENNLWQGLIDALSAVHYD